MRRVGVAFLVSSSLILCSCQAVVREFRHPGGYPGYLLDRRSFDASGSKQLQLLRAAIVIAMAARMSQVTSNGPDEADAVAKYLGAAADELNYTAANIYDDFEGGVVGPSPCLVAQPAPTKTAKDLFVELNDAVNEAKNYANSARISASEATAAQNAIASGSGERIVISPRLQRKVVDTCPGYFVNFESDIPLLESRIARLMFATLPQDRLKEFAEDVQEGNILGGAWSAVKLLVVGARGLHQAAGTYRTGQEALVANLDECGAENKNGPRPEEATMTVADAVKCLGLPADTLFGPFENELKGKNLSKPNLSKGQAEKRLEQVEFFKRQGKK